MTPAITQNIQIDPALEQEAQKLFESLGLNLNTAITIFLRQSVREGGIPFHIGQPVYNEDTLRAIEEARQGINVSKAYDSVEELLEALNAED